MHYNTKHISLMGHHQDPHHEQSSPAPSIQTPLCTCQMHTAALPPYSPASCQPACWELTQEGRCRCVRSSAIACHQLVFGFLLSVLLAYIMLFCHKGVVESGMAEATELVWVCNVLVFFIRRYSRGGEGSRMFLWGHHFCRMNPNSWSVR